MIAIAINDVSYRYAERSALEHVHLEIGQGEVFALLGPNGSGKTTLFRLITTLIPLQQGQISVMHADVRRNPHTVRTQLGVVFQAPSLDPKLTVLENLQCQAALYGLSGSRRATRISEALSQLGLTERAGDRAETLSGGLRRRVDLARGILAQPQVLILDEPTTALDPAARSDMWQYLSELRKQTGTTIVFTTHLLEEADRADRLAILDHGRVVICDAPDTLKQGLGGDVVSIVATQDPESLRAEIDQAFQRKTEFIDGRIRLECEQGHTWVPRLVQSFPNRIQSITMSKPTLEDVFVHHTGHRFWVDPSPATPKRRSH